MGKPEYPGENPLVRCSANPMILILMRVSLPSKLRKTTRERDTHTYTLTCVYIYIYISGYDNKDCPTARGR